MLHSVSFLNDCLLLRYAYFIRCFISVFSAFDIQAFTSAVLEDSWKDSQPLLHHMKRDGLLSHLRQNTCDVRFDFCVAAAFSDTLNVSMKGMTKGRSHLNWLQLVTLVLSDVATQMPGRAFAFTAHGQMLVCSHAVALFLTATCNLSAAQKVWTGYTVQVYHVDTAFSLPSHYRFLADLWSHDVYRH